MTSARRRGARAVGALAIVLLTGGCAAVAERATPQPVTVAPSPDRDVTASPATPHRPGADPAEVAAGLDAPWSVVVMPDGTQLVSERDTGAVLEIGADGTVREVGRIPGVVSGGEGGLHGLAVRERDEQLWLYAYHGAETDNRVVRLALTGDAGSRTLGDAEMILDGIPRASTHNGGRIAFGPDGFLYVTTGDAGLRDAAQDPDSLAGKILRLTPEGEAAPGNPFDSRVYSLGHRNVQGIAWTTDGQTWASEFGQNTFDEVNRIVAGGNYGWPVHEGVAGDAAYVDPIVAWTPSDASPSGLAAAGSTLFVAGLRGERVWMLDVADDALAGDPVALWAGEYGRMRDAVVAGDELWLLTGNTDGRGSPGPGDDRLLRVPLTAG
ncbi:PQQ-dependent sugar dehydrogenase [Microbacterium lushaniae]|uniref:PQQ-dependent sugar dehydrogenase n=1 Tax=Microbacterium lushaniae TaxID=2614639 RepID=A0A5J6L342_9MICO|nr:PQQ-dependent sugar dehydrogenase [Microbacterium lushaniae]QEW02900.1 PQQ-dependent sugar dehydrogenase [Microbacterium lushaniae]